MIWLIPVVRVVDGTRTVRERMTISASLVKIPSVKRSWNQNQSDDRVVSDFVFGLHIRTEVANLGLDSSLVLHAVRNKDLEETLWRQK